MAMIALGCGQAASQVITAIGEVVIAINRINNDHEVTMANITNQHQKEMAILQNKENHENRRHEAFMKLLDILDKKLDKLGKAIFEAECAGCKGLPGNQI